MKFVDWNTVEEKSGGGFNEPRPGGYIAVIRSVFDSEEKEYLRLQWDFAEGEFKGRNQATRDRAGFWPMESFWSYKESALGYFKQKKTALEKSNVSYRFNTENVQGMVGKLMGVVLGEEEYRKGNGAIGKRLYVHQVRSVQAIRDGDFKTPDLKRLSSRNDEPAPSGHSSYEDDGPLPWD